MVSWIVVSRSKHAESRWLPRQSFDFAAQLDVVEVLAREISALLPHYTLTFIKKADESYQLSALLGLGFKRNFYVTQEGQWLCESVPAVLRGYPFMLAKGKNNALCIDENRLSAEEEAIAIFDEGGKLAPAAAEMLVFLQDCENDRQKTEVACASLAGLGILKEWPLKADRGDDKEPKSIQGLYRVDEEALNSLDNESLGALRSTGGLLLAYAQLFSLNQLAGLSARSGYLGDQAAAAAENKKNLAALFEDGGLNFDSF